MSLMSRLSGVPGPGETSESLKKIGFNQLVAAIAERQRGKISAASIVDQFELTPDETAELVVLYNKLTALTNNAQRVAFLNELQHILYLAEMEFDGSANGGLDYGNLATLEARFAEM